MVVVTTSVRKISFSTTKRLSKRSQEYRSLNFSLLYPVTLFIGLHFAFSYTIYYKTKVVFIKLVLTQNSTIQTRYNFDYSS